MEFHITLFLYVIFFLISIIGYGAIFSKIVNIELLSLNIGYIGIIGFLIMIKIYLYNFLIKENF